MADSDAEELSVGVPSPVPGKHYPTSSYVIDGDEDVSSGFSTPSRSRNDLLDLTSGDSSSASQRHPTCALCKNHGENTPLKGHKMYCPWRDCPCELCYGTKKKQKINANQVALRRAQALDEERRKKGLPAPTKRTTPSPLLPTSSSSGKQSNQEHKVKSREGLASSNLGRDPYPPPKRKADSPSQMFSPVITCQSGPVALCQELSCRSVLLSRHVQLLSESLSDSRLDLDSLKYLFPIIQSVKDEVEKASLQLSEIHQEAQFSIRMQSEEVAASSLACPLPNRPEQIPRSFPPVHFYPFPLHLQPPVRASVINTSPYAINTLYS